MELKEMIKVMQHYENGGEVEIKEKYFVTDWQKINNPNWNWSICVYRIKEPKQKVTIERWLCIDEQGDYAAIESSNIDKYKQYEKVKLIESYEIEL